MVPYLLFPTALILLLYLKVRLARGRRNFKEMVLKEGQHFGEIMMLLPEHVPFRGLAQVSVVGNSYSIIPSEIRSLFDEDTVECTIYQQFRFTVVIYYLLLAT